MSRKVAGDSPALFNLETIVILFGIFLLCYIWLGLHYKMQGERQLEIDHAAKETSNLARSFEEHTLRTVKSADEVVLFLKFQYEKEGRKLDFKRLIQQGRLNGQPFLQLGIIDENGNLAYTSVTPFVPVQLGDREHFLIHKNFDSGKLFISKPVLGRETHRWSIQMTRRINKPDGSFGGVAVVSVDPNYFSRFYHQVNLGKNSVIELIGRDGIVRARQSGRKITLGQNLNRGFILRLPEGKRVSGYKMVPSPVDRIVRLYSFRVLHEYPLVVLVGISEAEIFRDLEQRFKVYYFGAGLITLVILGFIFVLLHLASRQQRTAAALKQARAHLEFQVEQRTEELLAASEELQLINRDLEAEILERSQAEELLRNKEEDLRTSKEMLSMAAGLANLGPWEYNPATNLFQFGDEFYAIYGTDTEREGRSMPPEVYARQFVHPDDAWVVQDSLRKAQMSQDFFPAKIEHRIIRRDGEVRTVIVRENVIRDDRGNIIKHYGANQDITERVRAEEALRQQAETIRHLAYYDSLTGLSNRAQLNERLRLEIESACRNHTQGAVIFIDLDDLKMVNDTYGHTYGDTIIVEAGARIVAVAGENAFIARVGGDEFILILPGSNDRQQIEKIAMRIREALERKHEVLGTHFHMTASIGIAIYPADGETVEEIIKNADNAMYAAKRDGKNCWRFYNTVMQTEVYQKMSLLTSLRYALQRREFTLHYQPQILASNGAVIGFEALLRWNSSEFNSVSPQQFIPLAEQSGLIQPIGQWVLREACRFAKRLEDQGSGNLQVAVNISSKQLNCDDFIGIVREAIATAGIQPRQLELEITESSLMTSLEDATRKLAELKELGVRLALDDFGTGYSSLTYLRNLPVETVKIDKSFIDMIAIDANVTKITGSIITMAHILNMKVIAEGVENERQLEYLAGQGCDCIQGYLFSRPVPEEEAIIFSAVKKTE